MERDFQLMRWLDAHNYAKAWIDEHHSGGYVIYGQPELFIATAAERTRRIRLGGGVISLPYHHPLMVAARIVQLDYPTRGRAIFGFGPGMLPSDAMMLGIDLGTSTTAWRMPSTSSPVCLKARSSPRKADGTGCARRGAAASAPLIRSRGRILRSPVQSRLTRASSPGVTTSACCA